MSEIKISKLDKSKSFDDLKNIKSMGLSEQDLQQINQHGVSLDAIKKQLSIFKKGIAKMELLEAATVGNGILKLANEDFVEKAHFFDEHKSNLKLLKFVPASGAATRMFKFLTAFLNDFNIEKETINAYINRKKDTKLPVFIVGMEKLPFFEMIYEKLKEEIKDFDSFSRDYKNYYFIKFMLDAKYFDFASKPKGILPFHKYATRIACPIEEHLYECGYYSSANGKSYLHFTVSESHQVEFEKIIDDVKTNVEKETQTSIEVSYSYQDKSTDTIAVNMNDKAFRTEDGKLLFRPGGHGALIGNLNRLDADVIFIKNIDNVILHNNETIALYKKALSGILLELQQEIFACLNVMDLYDVNDVQIDEIKVFLKNKLNVSVKADFDLYTSENKIKVLRDILNRPIRVCGMVINEGEPGGGPFWVKNGGKGASLQIVESSQVDLTNKKQAKIMANATHFNPVDLVCATKNYKNEKFDLHQFVDENAGFIVEKNHLGKDIKGYELPGLWNGAMANWLTVFVEVPLITFNPVKTVNDLLKEAHQSL
ncbi:protein of unknown function [Flavobacterium glycines]|uniref:DUF4301 domain-containing protein n=2 Tax=Flavobacterium glycines TaxID=551990 RepID=A0A511CBH3_9FLAO|nr:DUF4301 family protein [Flavobacterium glycines]GEL10011.1 hypothetical protein FGL01_07500 [Flavobacterium glycines]SDI84937.1 protein of unknown function [Flavobacterium glycines]